MTALSRAGTALQELNRNCPCEALEIQLLIQYLKGLPFWHLTSVWKELDQKSSENYMRTLKT
jgi:hypothetical protein